MAGMFKLNFSEEDKESTAKAGGYDPIPAGVYELAITDIELGEVKNGANAGKPMLKVEMTSQEEEGPSKGRKFWCNVMLFDLPSGNWFIAQFLKATGFAEALETGNIPTADQFMGKSVQASVVRKIDKYRNEQEPKPDGTKWYRNEINGFVTDDSEVTTTSAGRKKKNSLLP